MKRHLWQSAALAVFFNLLNVQISFAQERAFFGNLHSHTSYSDGLGTPREAFIYARDIAKLDFLALTEHNHREAVGTDHIGIATNPALYKGADSNSLISAARDLTSDNRFIALYGQEFSTISSGNHMNVFEIGEVITAANGRFDLLLDFLNVNKDSSGQPALVMFNHPDNSFAVSAKEYGLDDFGGNINRWVGSLGLHAGLIQIINGPGMSPETDRRPANPDEDAYLKFLSLGFKLAPTADQDNHRKNWGNATTARTGAIMSSLTKMNLLKALKSRHVYATEDKNLSVIIKVNGSLCGDVIASLPQPSELAIRYSISDADEPDADYEIQVWRGAVGGDFARMVTSLHVESGSGAVEDVAFSGEPQYFFFKIIQHSDDGNVQRAWTAPVWFERPAGPQMLISEPAADPQVDTAIASKKSEVFHVSDACLDAKHIKPANIVRGAEARTGRRQHQKCPRIDPNQ